MEKAFSKIFLQPGTQFVKKLGRLSIGMLLSVAAGLVVAAIFPGYFKPYWATILFSLLLNVLGQAGDLFESSLSDLRESKIPVILFQDTVAF